MRTPRACSEFVSCANHQANSEFRNTHWRWRPVLVVLFVAILSEVTFAQEPDTSRPAQKSVAENAKPDGEKERDRKEQSAIVGGLLLLLLVIVSVASVSLLAIWGRRTRRLARQSLPQSSQLDPLWYLRKPNASSSDSQTDNSPSQESNHQ